MSFSVAETVEVRFLYLKTGTTSSSSSFARNYYNLEGHHVSNNAEPSPGSETATVQLFIRAAIFPLVRIPPPLLSLSK
jgi:hypothetical protein